MLASRSVRTRFLLVVLATTLAALLVSSAAMIFYHVREYQQSLSADLAAQAEILAPSNADALKRGDRDAARDSLAILKAKTNIVAGALYSRDGGLFALYTREGTSASAIPAAPESRGLRMSGQQVVMVKPIAAPQGGEIVGNIYLRGDYDLTRHIRQYAAILAVVLTVSVLAAMLMWLWLQSSVTAPILEMRDVARRVVESRDFDLRARKQTNDELGYLAEAFNRMLAEIGQRTRALESSNATLAGEIRDRERAQGALVRAEDELKALNAELEQRVAKRTAELAAANKELESFSYSVSHDLRAPVRAIAGFSRLLAEQHGEQLDAEAQRKLGIVRSEAARMAALIDDLLAFSRLGRQTLQMKSVDMEELVRMNIETLNAGHAGAPPAVRIGSLPLAHGDRSLLAQVWANLLANAYKFSAKKDTPAVEIDAYDKDGTNVYFVRDNGVGFDPRFQSKLFGVFQRLHDPAEFPGTGVGLALVERIVARHGGEVWAEGQPGAGATFYFSLPQREDHGTV